MNDVIKVLEESTRIKHVWNTKSKSWNYDVIGKDIGGESLTIRIAVTEDGIVLVTGF